tara:strand:+ start:152 stop:529 length:378 start_codon:yes stop_codon:yes gene_type:complete
MKFLLALLFSVSMFSQTVFENEKGNTKITLEDNKYIITFDDENDPVLFDENGMFIQAKGKLELTDKEFKQLINNIGKVMKKSEGNIGTDKYDLDKFSFVNDTVFLWVNSKIGSFSKEDLKQLKKL